MNENEEFFEMAPPNMFSVIGGKFLASGKKDRHQDVTPAARECILDYCRQMLRGSTYPAHLFYPDLVGASIGEDKPALCELRVFEGSFSPLTRENGLEQ